MDETRSGSRAEGRSEGKDPFAGPLTSQIDGEAIKQFAIRPAVPLKEHLLGIVGAEFVAEKLAA